MSYYTALSVLGNWMLATLPGVATGLFLSFVVSMAVLWFDRSVMTMDTSQMKRSFAPLLGRIMIAIVFTAVSALMLETMVFYTMAEHNIRQRETAAAQELISLAVSDTSREYDILIAGAEKQAAGITVVKDEKKKKLDDYTARRATERAELVDRHNGIIAPLQADYDRAQQEYLDASKRFGYRKVQDPKNPGKFVSVRVRVPYGKEEFKAARDDLASELKKARANRDAELKKFDEETTGQIVKLEEKRDKDVAEARSQVGNRVQQLKDEKRGKINEIRRTKDPEELDALARVHDKLWREDRSLPGYLAESMKIVQAGGTPALILVILMHLFFFAFEMLPFLWKFTAGREREIVAYYSLGQTALRGNADAQALVKGMGYSDAKEYARDGESRGIADRMRHAIHNLREWLQRREAFITSLAQIRDTHPRYMPLPEIQLAMASWWVNGQNGDGRASAAQALEAYLKCIREVTASGASAPSWKDLVGEQFPDPANQREPWNVSIDRLRQDGWVDPAEIVAKGLKAESELGSQLRTVQSLHARLRAGVAELVRKNPNINRAELEAFAYDNYVKRLMNPIQKFHEGLEAIERAGLPKPNLPQDVNQLLAPDTGAIWKIDERQAIALGWKKGNEKTLTAGSSEEPPKAPIPLPDDLDDDWFEDKDNDPTPKPIAEDEGNEPTPKPISEDKGNEPEDEGESKIVVDPSAYKKD
ncbi:MAG: DUF4407 domain-containing protein [Candidatus Magasanikbacteria bacterium]|nr:DUF4407 domain-containing protein [Candidatus Magasanikbacteria bacterium]